MTGTRHGAEELLPFWAPIYKEITMIEEGGLCQGQTALAR
jgi:hypothetical protein